MNSDKPFISIKVNGSDLYELNLEDLKKLQDEIQNYINDIETNEREDNNEQREAININYIGSCLVFGYQYYKDEKKKHDEKLQRHLSKYFDSKW